MKLFTSRPALLLGSCALFWLLGLLVLAIPGLRDEGSLAVAFLPVILLIAVLLTITSAVVFLFKLSAREPNNENFAYGVMAKVLAGLLVAALLISVATAIRSLWPGPFPGGYGDRYVYENIATGAGVFAIALTIVLSALQKDIYWVTRKKTVELDERQLQERREVFETSYKISAVLMLVIVWWLNTNLELLPAIIANNHGSVPGHLYWIGVDFVVTLFALPLLVAVWGRSVWTGSTQRKASR